MPVGLLQVIAAKSTADARTAAELPGDIHYFWQARRHITEIQLHPHQIRKRGAVDNDTGRAHFAAMDAVPLKPEQQIVTATRHVVAFIGQR